MLEVLALRKMKLEIAAIKPVQPRALPRLRATECDPPSIEAKTRRFERSLDDDTELKALARRTFSHLVEAVAALRPDSSALRL